MRATFRQPALPFGSLSDHTFDPVTRRSMMKDAKRSHSFFSTAASAVSTEVKADCRDAGPVKQLHRFNFSTCSAGKPQNVSFSSKRCSEKGCVFPSSSRGNGRCTYHRHQQEEPALFRSHQPTGLLLDPARSIPTERDDSSSRKSDRRRMATIWEQFQSDGMAFPDDSALK